MAFEIISTEIGPRDEALEFDDLGPGLYLDESVARLDSGELVAVSAKLERAASSNGVTVIGWARAINPDGSTMLDPDSGELEVEFRPGFTAHDLSEHGSSTLIRWTLLAMLGEELPTRAIPGGEVSVLPLADDVLSSISIRSALAASSSAEADIDAGAILA